MSTIDEYAAAYPTIFAHSSLHYALVNHADVIAIATAFGCDLL
jgi:hypothetical protein